MEPRQLRALLAIEEHGSFSSAARALNTVQSNISTHVSRLEKELDVVLVDRATCRLTSEGAVVAARARRIESEFHALESDVAALRGAVRGTVRLGVIGSTARWLVPSLLAEVSSRFPEVHLVVRDATTSSLVPQVSIGSLDFAIVNAPVSAPELLLEPLFREERVAVIPAGHPLYDTDEITLDDLAVHELLLPNVGTSYRNELDADIARLGKRLKPRAEIDGITLLANLAASGFGAAVLPASGAPPDVEGQCRTVVIKGLSKRTVAVCRRRRSLPTPAEAAAIAVVKHVVTSEVEHHQGLTLD